MVPRVPSICFGLIVSFVLLSSASAQSSLVRVVVTKNPAPNRTPDSLQPAFSPILSSRPAASGFSLVAEYPARALYEGPAAAGLRLVADLEREGYGAEITNEPDSVLFNDYRVNADTGVATPAVAESTIQPSGAKGLYLLALKSYPTPSWMSGLSSAGITVVEALPPTGYLVHADRHVMAGIQQSATYIRGVFPVVPGMKKVLLGPAPGPSPFRKVIVLAVEESSVDSLGPHLAAVAQEVISAESNEGHARYIVSLSDLDIENLTLLENVYAISEIHEMVLSSERQGALAIQPITTGALTLPSMSPNYWNFIQGKGIADFSNSIVALLDTGLDNWNDYLIPPTHPDFSSGVVQCRPFLPTPDRNCRDRNDHGTLTASVIAGYELFGSRADTQSYGYGLGIAPKVKLIVDKYFDCAVARGDLPTSLQALSTHSPAPPNIVNLSFNVSVNLNRPDACDYTVESQDVDRRARLHNWLFTIAAGNGVAGECLNTRAPATAKNAIAVGATENVTLNWIFDAFTHVEECSWCKYPPDFGKAQDARNIPTMSPTVKQNSMLKPDLVAAGLRITGPFTREALCNVAVSSFCNRNIGTPQGFQYGFSGGTSFSAPAAAGAAAVVRKWYRNLRASDPSPAMTKAILMNGARTLFGGIIHGKDFAESGKTVKHIYSDGKQGWGGLSFDRLLGPASNYYFKDQDTVLSPGNPNWLGLVTVRDGSKAVRITLVWTDAPGMIGTDYIARNDLGLTAYYSPCFPCWYGNNFSLTTGETKSSGTFADSKNNVEEIIIPAGSYASGTILNVLVDARNVVADGLNPDGVTPRQDFALFVQNGF